MSFRDDHEAALARAAALEVELRRARTKLARAEGELDEVRREGPATPPARLADRVPMGLLVLVLGAVFAIPCVMWGSGGSPPEQEWKADPGEPTRAVPALRDEVRSYLREETARAREGFAGGQLIELEGTGIDRQGRLDPASGVLRFVFHRETPERAHECLRVVRTPGAWWGADYGRLPCDFPASAPPRAIEPRCTMRTIWTIAAAAGAPEDARARIRFDGDRWHFAIEDPPASFEATYSDNCEG